MKEVLQHVRGDLRARPDSHSSEHKGSMLPLPVIVCQRPGSLTAARLNKIREVIYNAFKSLSVQYWTCDQINLTLETYLSARSNCPVFVAICYMLCRITR